MAVCGERHKKLNEQGIGLCSVPMWSRGMPAGFCDADAYGERPPCKTYIVGTGKYARRVRKDGKYSGYVMYLACPDHGGPTVRVFMDGDQFCAVRPDFTNLQESPAGFGDTREEAIDNLEREVKNGSL